MVGIEEVPAGALQAERGQHQQRRVEPDRPAVAIGTSPADRLSGDSTRSPAGENSFAAYTPCVSVSCRDDGVRVRVRITAAPVCPAISEFALY